MNQYQSKPETHLCFKCRSKFSTDKEADFNKMRVEILARDQMEGKKTITIAEKTDKAIQRLSSERNGATYDDIILAALGALKRENENKGYDQLESIANAETEET